MPQHAEFPLYLDAFAKLPQTPMFSWKIQRSDLPQPSSFRLQRQQPLSQPRPLLRRLGWPTLTLPPLRIARTFTMFRLALPLYCALFGLALYHQAPELQARTPSENIPVAADLIVTNARIWTACKTQPAAESLAVWRDRILALGSTPEMLRLAGPATR